MEWVFPLGILDLCLIYNIILYLKPIGVLICKHLMGVRDVMHDHSRVGFRF